MEFRGRVQDWMAEIRASREREETVLFLAETPGRAERMLEVAREYGVIAAPLDRAEDAHAATLLVGLGRLSRGFRLPTGRLVLYAETRRLRGGAARPRAPPCGDAGLPVGPARPEGWTISSSTSITASACSSA